MNNPTLKEQAHGEIEKIFRILLPQNGLAVREEQIALCHAMLDTLLKNNIALCDAGVGIGKTYAYLTACILLKKFAPHGPAGSQPVVISTSSVTLQDAIIGEYIPFLSRIFLENRVISKPIRAIVRKGKERFVCDARLSQRLEAVKDKNKNAEQLKALLSLRTYYDLDSVTGLSGFDRRQVCVPKLRKEKTTIVYTSVIPVHRLDNAIDYALDEKKSSRAENRESLEGEIDKALNKDQSEQDLFQSAIGCTIDSAFEDMCQIKKIWHKEKGVQGFHLVQSFAPGEISPELAHQIGVEFADRLFGGKFQAVVSTHLNTKCIHNHIVWNSVSMENGKKYRSNEKNYVAGVWKISDELCVKHLFCNYVINMFVKS